MAASHLEFLYVFSHLPISPARMAAPKFGRSDMTLFYSHHDRLHGSAGAGYHPIVRTLKRVRSTLRIIHRAIAAAKIRRIRHELMLHGGAYHWAQKAAHDGHAGEDAAKFPRRPLILGDKWDF
jgi:hypothetical protein